MERTGHNVTKQVIGPFEGRPSSPKASRATAIAEGDLWAGYSRFEPGMETAWHHHGDARTVVYVASGRMRVESGPRGADVIEAGIGDFLYGPLNAIHRETNPYDEDVTLVVFSVGTGEGATDVPGPAS